MSGFRFTLRPTRGDGRHWTLGVHHDELGAPDRGASVEFARRPLVLTPEQLAFVPLVVHRAYGLALPILPAIAEAEACAEKLARYRRSSLGRDVYDLAQFAGRPIDERHHLSDARHGPANVAIVDHLVERLRQAQNNEITTPVLDIVDRLHGELIREPADV